MPAHASIDTMSELVPGWNPEIDVELVVALIVDVVLVCTMEVEVDVVVDVIVFVKVWPAPPAHPEGQYLVLNVFPLEVRMLT